MIVNFNQLLQLYLDDKASNQENDKFFEMVATGFYDDEIRKSLDKDFESEKIWKKLNINNNDVEEKVRSIILKSEQHKISWLKKLISIHKGWLVAAFLIIVTSITWFKFNAANYSNSFTSQFISNSSFKITNTTSESGNINLPDGSIVVLQPSASLFYSKEMFLNNREVCLKGEAFFKVTKNPSKPFKVYAGDIVTKVLGTTFKINTNKSNDQIEVEVLSGKVQVYKNFDGAKNARSKIMISITPNQKAVYEPQKEIFNKYLVNHPMPLFHNIDATELSAYKSKSFKYSNTPLSVIFKEIQSSYNIEIIRDENKIKGCLFSGDLSSPDLFEKLKIIGLVTNLIFSVKDTKIIIKEKGC